MERTQIIRLKNAEKLRVREEESGGTNSGGSAGFPTGSEQNKPKTFRHAESNFRFHFKYHLLHDIWKAF